jgi:hypothetical protein
VVRAAKVGQKTVPDLRGGTVTQGSFTCNLKLKARVGARVRFTLPEPGIYLLRVEKVHTHSDHEHFSAIDVKAEESAGRTVAKVGLEPTRPCGHRILRPARLPIPSLGRLLPVYTIPAALPTAPARGNSVR